MEITIQPTEADMLNGIDTTTLDITVDVTSIMHLMNTHDLVLKTTLDVAIRAEDNTVKRMTYHFAKLYETLHSPQISYKAIVVGQVSDVNSIQGRAEGTMVLRGVEGGK